MCVDSTDPFSRLRAGSLKILAGVDPGVCVSPPTPERRETAVTAPVCPVFRVVVAGRYLGSVDSTDPFSRLRTHCRTYRVAGTVQYRSTDRYSTGKVPFSQPLACAHGACHGRDTQSSRQWLRSARACSLSSSRGRAATSLSRLPARPADGSEARCPQLRHFLGLEPLCRRQDHGHRHSLMPAPLGGHLLRVHLALQPDPQEEYPGQLPLLGPSALHARAASVPLSAHVMRRRLCVRLGWRASKARRRRVRAVERISPLPPLPSSDLHPHRAPSWAVHLLGPSPAPNSSGHSIRRGTCPRPSSPRGALSSGSSRSGSSTGAARGS